MTTKKTQPKRKLTQRERDAYALVGSLGGKATARKKGRKYMQELGKKAAAKRWGHKSPKL